MQALNAYIVVTSAGHVLTGFLLSGFYAWSAFNSHQNRLCWSDLAVAIIAAGAATAASIPIIDNVGMLLA